MYDDKTNDTTPTFGEWLKYQRKLLSLTQKRLAAQVGCASVTIRHIESSIFRPSEHMVERILKVLDVPQEEHAMILHLARSTVPAQGDEKRARAPCRNPYKGLQAFEETDAEDFFGRDALIARLVMCLSQNQSQLAANLPATSGRFLAVVGPSGSGKSSVVRAGLIPALRAGKLPGSDQWLIADMYPGAYPFEELRVMLAGLGIHRQALGAPQGITCRLSPAENSDAMPFDVLGQSIAQALSSTNGSGHAAQREFVLVIDQFEEFFTQCSDEQMRLDFFAFLHHFVTTPDLPVRVIMTLRADFYDRPLRYRALAELIRHHTELVVPLTPEELEQAITGPAQRIGLAIEPDLVKAMIWDVAAQPGSLPLLQYTLTELFDHRDGRTLTRTAYEHHGRIMGTLARRAETLFKSLSEPQQHMARQLFLRLVTPGEGIADTRRRVPLSELDSLMRGDDRECDDHTDPLEIVIDLLSRYRLLTFDHEPVSRQATVEIAHEALITSWERLHSWIDEHRDGLRLHRALTEAAQRWESLNRDAGALYRGALLARAREWVQIGDTHLNALEQHFLDVSIEAQERDEREKEEARQRELAQARALAESEQQRADAERQRAEEQQRRAEAESQRAEEQQRRADAERQHAEAESQRAEVERLRAEEREITARRLRRRAVVLSVTVAVAVLAMLAAVLAGVQAQQREEEARRERIRAEQHATMTEGLALAAEANNQLVQGDPNQALALALAATEKNIAIPYADVLVSDAAYTAARRQFAGHMDSVQQAIWGPDGHTMLSASSDGTLRLWDTDSGDELRRFEGHTSGVYDIAFSPDGRFVLSAAKDATVRLWDVAQGLEIRRFQGHTDAVYSVAFTPDGQKALSASRDTTIRIWDVHASSRTRSPVLKVLRGHTDAVWCVVVSPDGRLAVSASHDLTMRLWDIERGKEIGQLHDWVNDMAFSPDGHTLISGSVAGVVRLWDIDERRERMRFNAPLDPVWSVAFSPDGKTALTGSQGASMRLWDVATGEEIRHFNGHSDAVSSVAYSPNGTMLLSASHDGTIRLWDMDNGAQEHKVAAPGAVSVEQVFFMPDGASFVSRLITGTLNLWDSTTGTQLASFSLPTERMNQLERVDDPLAQFITQQAGILTASNTLSRTIPYVGAQPVAEGGLAVRPDGRMLAASSNSSLIWVWAIDDDGTIESPPHRLAGHNDWVSSLTFSPDGRWLISAANDRTMRVWDVETGDVLYRFERSMGHVQAVVSAPDGKMLVSGSDDSIVRVWDIENNEEVRRFIGHTGLVSSVAFSPDGQAIVSGSHDKTVRVWDMQTGQEHRRFVGHTGRVTSVAFSPDGQQCLSASQDGTVRVWDIATGTELRRFWGHTQTVQSVSYSPDGRLALSSSQDGTIRVWRVDATMDDVRAWVARHRYVATIGCGLREDYRVLPLCD